MASRHQSLLFTRSCSLPWTPSRPGSITSCRSFSTTSTLSGSADRKLARLHRHVPEYPYAPRNWYKQSNFGLYAGGHIRFGNNVSEEFENKSRRCWKPNVRTKKLWSLALERWVPVKLTMRAMRTIDKEGGLDNYLLGEKPARIKELGMEGWLLRWRLISAKDAHQKIAPERELPVTVDSLSSSESGGAKEGDLRDGIDAFDEALDEMDRRAEVGDQKEADNDYEGASEAEARQLSGRIAKPMATT